MKPHELERLQDGVHPALARRLARLRLRRGWNMDHVARLAGISRTTLFHLERGATRRPRGSTLHKLARTLEVPVESLLDETFGETLVTGDDSASPLSMSKRRRAAPPENDASAARAMEQCRAFDRATNTVVTAVAASRPDLFTGWTTDEWDELYSQFATGGALRETGVESTTRRINDQRETVHRLRLVLQTHLSPVAVEMVDALYRLVQAEPDMPPRPPETD
jgi:transcriptional regulator with XRE-family HTH domain